MIYGNPFVMPHFLTLTSDTHQRLRHLLVLLFLLHLHCTELRL